MTASISDYGVTFSDTGAAPQQFSISASVAASALTFTLQPSTISFRSSTLGTGGVTTIQNTSALTLTISAGSTLGTLNATAARIVLLAINNAGTVELAAVNIAGGNQLDETNLISTTAEGGAGGADSASTIYSAAARSNVAYRVVGFIDSTQATAGTWATAPSTIQGCGGQALSALSSLGYSQTWQSVTGSRSSGTTYYNTTGRPISVHANLANTATGTATITINGVAIAGSSMYQAGSYSCSGIVPPGGSYVVTGNAGQAVNAWVELR